MKTKGMTHRFLEIQCFLVLETQREDVSLVKNNSETTYAGILDRKRKLLGSPVICSSCPYKLLELPQHPAMEDDLLSGTIFLEGLCNFELKNFSSSVVRFSLEKGITNYQVSIDDLAFTNSSSSKKIENRS